MSTRSIDERIVDMQFNNRQFEAGVKESLGSIEALKKGLDFKEAEKSFSGLSDSARKFSLSGLAESIENISSKFTALGIIGVTALANIANKAVDAGIQLVKSLTVDQIAAGWDKYGQKMDSVQTIMNATGKSVEEVDGYLEKFMWFSDETSYGFTDMTKALAQMTSSGGNIDKLMPMIMGVANATAYAGKGAAEFSRAMYNLNQSYSMGSLQYRDWFSLELAGVASAELKQTIIDVGVEMGKIEKGAVTVGTFGSTLQEKWADTSVMEEAFGRFASMSEKAYEMVQSGQVDTASQAYKILAESYDDVYLKAAKSAQEAKKFSEVIAATTDAVSSGWAKTFEMIFGNKVEATEFFTDLANAMYEVFVEGGNVRNELLKLWKDEGGRDDFIQGFWNLWDAIGAFMKPIKEAFQEIFPPMTVDRLLKFTKSFEEFTAKLKIGDDTAAKIKSTFKGLFAIVDIGKEFFLAIGKAIGNFIKLLAPAGEGLLDYSGSIGDWLVSVDEAIKANDFFTESFKKVKDFIKEAAKTVKEAIGKMIDAFGELTGLNVDSLGEFAQDLKEKFHPLEAIGDFLKQAIDLIKDILKKAGPAIGKAAQAIGDGLSKFNLTGLVNLIATGGFAGIALGIKGIIDSFKTIAQNAGGFLESITGLLDGVRDCLKAYQNDIQAGTLLKIAGAIAVLAGALYLLSIIDTGKLGGALIAITTLFAELFGSMALFQKSFTTGGFRSLTQVTIGMILMSTAVLILATAVEKLAGIGWEDIASGVLAIGALLAMLVGAAKLMSQMKGGFIGMSVGLIGLALSIKIMVSALKDLSEIPMDKLTNGLMALLGILAGISLFMLAAKSGGLTIGDAAALVAIGIGVKLISDAVMDLGKIDPKQIGIGLAALTVILLELVLFVNTLNTSGGLLSTAIGIGILGLALGSFVTAIERLGQMNLDTLLQGLVGLGSALLIIAGAMALMPPNMLGVGIGMLAVGAGLLLIANAMTVAASLSWEEIAKGLVALGGALLIIALAVNLMTGALAGAAALLIVSAALLGLAFVMKILGGMSLEEIGLALLSIVGVLAVLGAAALLLGPVIPIMLALGAALLLLGVGLVTVGAASIVLGIGLGVLAGAGPQGIEMLMQLAVVLLPLTLLAPGMLLVGAGLLVLAVGILAVGAALTVLGLGLGILMALGPAGNQALLDMANTAAQVAEFAVELLAAGAALLVFGAGALVAGAGALVAGVGILVLAAGMKALAEVDISNLEGISALSQELLLMSGQLLLATPGLLAGGAALVVFGAGAQTTGDGLASITGGMVGLMDVVKAIPDDISAATNAILNGVNTLIRLVSQAIVSQQALIVTSVANILSACVSTIQSYAGQFSSAGANVVDGFVSGIQSNAFKASAAAAAMAKSALQAANKELQIKSPSRAFGDTAKNSVLGFVEKFKEYTPLAMQAATDMGRKVLDPVFSMSDSFVIGAERAGSGLQRMAEKAMSMTPTIVEEKDTTVTHTFETLHVEGVNDKGEFVSAADYAVEKVLTAMMRRQSRV